MVREEASVQVSTWDTGALIEASGYWLIEFKWTILYQKNTTNLTCIIMQSVRLEIRVFSESVYHHVKLKVVCGLRVAVHEGESSGFFIKC